MVDNSAEPSSDPVLWEVSVIKGLLALRRIRWLRFLKLKKTEGDHLASPVVVFLRFVAVQGQNVALGRVWAPSMLERSVSEMKNIDLNDLRAFATLARAGALSGAARRLGVSPATLGRRMAALEERVGRKLIARSPTGYALTDDGRRLAERLEPFSLACADALDMLMRDAARPQVRLSCGGWTMQYLCRRFAALHDARDAFTPVLLEAEARLNLRHREIDIGLRDRPPDEDGLAGRRIGRVAFCVYAAADGSAEGWIAPPVDMVATDSARWLHARHAGRIALYASSPRATMELALQGVGRVVLPCFIGDAERRLARIGDLIPELEHGQWIVMRDEGRHRPEVRRMADRVIRLIRRDAALYAGQAPMAP